MAKPLPSSLLPAWSPTRPSTFLCPLGSACCTGPAPGFPPAHTVKTRFTKNSKEGGAQKKAERQKEVADVS